MMRKRPSLPALQRSYEEGYQACSNAIYYEGQGNEEEALRCWRSALSQVNDTQGGGSHSSPQSPFRPHSETEQALVDSLKQLELQCMERIDLLHALKMSREDSIHTPHDERNGIVRVSSDPPPYGAVGEEDNSGGWIGHGTVPAISYTELSRPALPPRSSMGSRASSVQAVVGVDAPSPDALHAARLPSFASPVPSTKQSRSPSPNKRTMRSTLRPNKSAGTSSRENARRPSSRTIEAPGAGKAAALAWSGIRDKFSPRPVVQSPAPSYVSGVRSPVDRRESSSAAVPQQREWDKHTRRLVTNREAIDAAAASERSSFDSARKSAEIATPMPSALSINAAASAIHSSSMTADRAHHLRTRSGSGAEPGVRPGIQTRTSAASLGGDGGPVDGANAANTSFRRKPISASHQPTRNRPLYKDPTRKNNTDSSAPARSAPSPEDDPAPSARRVRPKQRVPPIPADDSSQRSLSPTSPTDDTNLDGDPSDPVVAWEQKKKHLLKHLPPGVDAHAAAQILNEIVVRGDDVRWTDVAGLAAAKAALREAVVYPFLRPDLFMGLREPARGLLLFGPPGTGKTMLARAVATESRSTFFSISASSLTSKYLGESEKLVRALFELARILSPAIIFVDEIDSLLSPRSGGGGEHEASRRLKTEFLVQWSGLQRAAAGRASGEGDAGGDPNRVLVLAATNLPWAIDEAARRRFVRRQYIPLPDAETREAQIRTLLGEQIHDLGDGDIVELVALTDGFSGSDITALAKDAAMGPLRSLGEALLHTTTDQIRPINPVDFKASMKTIRPSVSPEGLKEYEDWARQYGERGG